MKKICFLLLFSSLFQFCFSQTISELLGEYDFFEERWNRAVLAKANTTRNIHYMSLEEKRVVFLCNLARLDGALFEETFLTHYLEKRKRKTEYVTSLQKKLKRVKNLPVLKVSKPLFDIAKEHATTSGKKGEVGHTNFNKRYKKILKIYGQVGENCDYGSNKAIDIVLSLLIDQNVPSLGHRENILSPSFKVIGVSIQLHTSYRFVCVQSFA